MFISIDSKLELYKIIGLKMNHLNVRIHNICNHDDSITSSTI